MNSKTQLNKYYPRLLLESLLKSLLWGMSAGFAASFIAALITWFTPFNGLWMALGAFVLVTAVVTLVLYFKKFRATVMNNARRIDRLGLEERLITMVEYQDDDSYIAQLQRADAQAALSRVDQKQIKFRFSQKLIVMLIVCGVLGCGMTTVNTLGYYGLLPNGSELIDTIMPDEMEVFVEVTYLVEEGGEIEGEADQLVAYGANAEPVLAIADDGYVFVGWDDGEIKPARTDRNVVKDIVVMAIFELIEDEEGDDEEGDEQGDEGGEDQAGEPGGSQNSNQNQDNEAKPEDPSSDAQQSGGKYDDYNQIIDGKTYYREYLNSYQSDIETYLKEHGDEFTEEEKAIILAYIGIV